jgi:hypothetical protein
MPAWACARSQAIRHNGTSIAPAVEEKMFNPTKPAREGTGLGVSISHDIIVKQHGRSLEVDTPIGPYNPDWGICDRARGKALFCPGDKKHN